MFQTNKDRRQNLCDTPRGSVSRVIRLQPFLYSLLPFGYIDDLWKCSSFSVASQTGRLHARPGMPPCLPHRSVRIHLPGPPA